MNDSLREIALIRKDTALTHQNGNITGRFLMYMPVPKRFLNMILNANRQEPDVFILLDIDMILATGIHIVARTHVVILDITDRTERVGPIDT